MKSSATIQSPLFKLNDFELYQNCIQTILQASGFAKTWDHIPSQVNFTLSDDAGITPVNESFLQHEGATDVISFDYQDDFDEDEDYCDEEPFIPGEIIISLEIADRYRLDFNHSLNEELLLYTAHGILHLCGYDDHEENDIKEMRAAEARMMTAIRQAHSSIEIVERLA